MTRAGRLCWGATVAEMAVAGVALDAQRGAGAGRGGPPPSGRAAAHFDLTGYWVPIITEDWQYRMVTPPKGDYRGVPLSAEGRRAADAWDPAADAVAGLACRAYGAGGLMRMPTRLHITWQDDQTLRIDSDAGEQTRLLRFAQSTPAAGEPDWQGRSTAVWEKQAQARGFNPRFPSSGPGVLKVVTTGMRSGYLRRNGVPYSDRASITEYFVRHADFGEEWFTVITTVEDSVYLSRSFITSTQFKREPDASKWKPAPCEIVPPLS
jgi:hypothetical protein